MSNRWHDLVIHREEEEDNQMSLGRLIDNMDNMPDYTLFSFNIGRTIARTRIWAEAEAGAEAVTEINVNGARARWVAKERARIETELTEKAHAAAETKAAKVKAAKEAETEEQINLSYIFQ